MRLGCLLTTAALLVSLVVEPPKAKAEALTLAVGGGIVLLAGYLTACGMVPYFTGDWNPESVARELQNMGQDFVEAVKPPGSESPDGGGPSFSDWLGTIVFTVSNGIVRFGKDAADKLNQFATWVASKYATKPGVNVVYSDEKIRFPDGTTYNLTTVNQSGTTYYTYLETLGSPIPYGTEDAPYTIRVSDEMTFKFYLHSKWGIVASGVDAMNFGFVFQDRYTDFYLTMFLGISTGDLCAGVYCYDNVEKKYAFIANETICLLDAESTKALLFGTDLSIDAADTVQQIFDRLTALEEGQSVALDVGATQSMEVQEILQGILDAILAGDLAATAEIVDEAAVPVDPPAETLPDVDGLGLPALGAALTSRFPFSIPWDVYKGISLLAAPAKAPYFEVDFMAPIADEVGGWKGSTKIVLDFSEFEIIGQVCRWTSTIGFCLMLATATKRLIWTA